MKGNGKNNCSRITYILLTFNMLQNSCLSARDLAVLAKRVRKKAGKTRAQAAREMKVSQTSIFQAEESPKQGLSKLRIRMISKYSDYVIAGPFFLLRQKQSA